MSRAKGKTPVRGIRIHGRTWEPAQAIGEIRGEDVSEVVRGALERYVARYRHLLPESGDEEAPADPLP